MGKLAYETQIYDRLRGKPHLRPVFSSVHAIPERLRAYDQNLFVVLNTKTQWYEVHSLDNKGDTFCLNIPLDELDARVLYLVRKGNIRVRGRRVLQEIEEHNKKLEAGILKKRDDDYRMAAREVRPLFKKFAYYGDSPA